MNHQQYGEYLKRSLKHIQGILARETGASMTESELLESPSFLKWCAIWEQDRHCPHAMADWALENVGELAFEACVWAHEKEERPRDDRPAHKASRPCPRRMKAGDGLQIFWKVWNLSGGYEESEEFPVPTDKWFDSFPAAIAYILTNFLPDIAAKYPPKVLDAI